MQKRPEKTPHQEMAQTKTHTLKEYILGAEKGGRSSPGFHRMPTPSTRLIQDDNLEEASVHSEFEMQ